MKVLCCHTGAVQANAAAALRLYAPQTEFVDVSGDILAYGQEIEKRWNCRESLVIVEHDNEITAEVITSFEKCDYGWCVYEYEIFAPPWTTKCNTGLGCVKFSAEFQQRLNFRQHVLVDACECGLVHNDWCNLDHRVRALAANIAGYSSPHVHGEIRHFHPYQPIDTSCYSDDGVSMSDISPFRIAAVNVKGGFSKVAG